MSLRPALHAESLFASAPSLHSRAPHSPTARCSLLTSWIVRAMKTEPMDNDPMAAFARAMAQAQNAIATERQEKIQARTALLESHRERRALADELARTEASNDRLRTQNAELSKRCDDLALKHDIAKSTAEARHGRIKYLMERVALIETSRRGERTGLDAEHAELEKLQKAVKEDQAALKTEKARVTREKNKFAKEQEASRSAFAGIKRKIEDWEGQFAQDAHKDDGNEPGGSSRRKRQRTGT
ncbi:hypothetical protein R3P38DRAFT_1296223 [Favolaschia claudopus]|uniref:Uncharacterized protein n=1 Tax=Favolaschia claudopus TaxID=2862362 RepID=A0AAW0AX61_9AGAR